MISGDLVSIRLVQALSLFIALNLGFAILEETKLNVTGVMLCLIMRMVGVVVDRHGLSGIRLFWIARRSGALKL